ncbi:hypothetical protein CONCODRAFT_14207, partial [Conidiobolus coronatus NRRL 28638]
ENKTVYDFANRFKYTASFSDIDPTIQYYLFKSNLRDDIKSNLDEENFKSNLNEIKTIGPPPNLRPRTFEKKSLNFEQKEKFKKDGICFYYREKGHIVRDCREDLSSKPIDKLLMINKTSPTLNTQQIDPSHLILNIQLNNLRTYAVLDTRGRYCYMSK